MKIIYKTAKSDREFESGKTLFKQYAISINIDLSFQDFSNELKTIKQQYNEPKGALLLAFYKNDAIGCAGIRELSSDTAELKRMYVMPEFRGYSIGKKILELSIDKARKLKYSKIRLDTLPEMIQAQKLYRSLGFYEISSYRFNPVKGTVYMEMNLE